MWEVGAGLGVQVKRQQRSAHSGPIHAGRKQMGPVDVNGGVHTARKQHQRRSNLRARRVPHPV